MRVTKLKFNEEFLAFNIEQATKKNGEIKFTFKSNFRDLCFGREVTKIVFQLEKTVEDETVIIA